MRREFLAFDELIANGPGFPDNAPPIVTLPEHLEEHGPTRFSYLGINLE